VLWRKINEDSKMNVVTDNGVELILHRESLTEKMILIAKSKGLVDILEEAILGKLSVLS
jgi:hypothetical protein